MRYAEMDTPVGLLTLACSENGLSSVQFGKKIPTDGIIDTAANQLFMDQLAEYFEAKRKTFDFPLDVSGTPFQMAVWNALIQIPYGQTRSYGDVAKSIGKPGAARAVGL